MKNITAALIMLHLYLLVDNLLIGFLHFSIVGFIAYDLLNGFVHSYTIDTIIHSTIIALFCLFFYKIYNKL